MWRRPGKVVFEFLPVIPPGLKRGPFMELLESRIEGASQALLEEHEARQALQRQRRSDDSSGGDVSYTSSSDGSTSNSKSSTKSDGDSDWGSSDNRDSDGGGDGGDGDGGGGGGGD
jgi:1-acyl-sn-glycerol-3-phosphate acyltransferase